MLFLIGREIEGSANIDRIVEERLRLTGSTFDKLAGPSQLGGLIIVIDGIDEHPSRDELLFSIIAQARRTRENGSGARFLLSWRSDEPQWAETMRESPRDPLWELRKSLVALARFDDALAVIDEYLSHTKTDNDRRSIAIAHEIRGDIFREADRH